MATRSRILVVGIGNELMGDDALGPEQIARLAARYEFTPEIELLDLGLGGSSLLDHLSGRDLVLIIDAFDISGCQPGAVVRLSKAELAAGPAGARVSPHELSLAETLAAADLLGAGAADVVMLGVKGACFELGAGLGAQLRAALPALDAAVARELERCGVLMKPRRRPAESETAERFQQREGRGAAGELDGVQG